MTTSNAAATAPVTTPVEEKAPSKMAQCQKLYDEVFAKGYDLDGKSQRAVFIARAIADLGMTKNGANTYYQNISNKGRGQPLYKYNKYVGKTGSKADTAAKAPKGEVGEDLPGATAVTKASIANAEKQATKTTADLTKRWQVLDGTEVVNSFDTRSKAKQAAVGGLTWADSQAAAE